jgi:hypothetical protein
MVCAGAVSDKIQGQYFRYQTHFYEARNHNHKQYNERVRGMKTISFIAIYAISLVVLPAGFGAQSDGDFVQFLRTAMEGERAHDYIIKEIITADPEQRKRLIAAVVQITTDAFNSPRPRSDADSHRIVTGAYVLRAASDNNATLAAFGSRLTEVEWPSFPPLIGALASCRDPRAVEAMADFARSRLKEIEPWPLESPPAWTDEQKRIAADTTLCFLGAVRGLAGSANPSGKAIARELRDKFVKLYDGSRLRDEILHTLEKGFGIDPLLRETAKQPAQRERAPTATSSVMPKQPQQSKSKKPSSVPQSSQKQGQTGIGTAIAAVVLSLVILGVLIWFLRRK